MSLDTIFKLSVIVGMIDHLTGPMARVNSSVGSSVSSIDKLNHSFGEMTKTGIAMATAGAQITGAVLSPVTATFGTRRALGELRAMGIKDFKTLENAAKDFSDTWAGTIKSDFLRAAVDIKGGIDSLSDEGVAGYTEIAGITAKATGSTIDEMTDLFATGYGIYKDFYADLSDFEFAEIFSAGIAEAILVFKASGSSMSQSIISLGGAATTANVPLEEQLAILGQLQATMSGSEAGTKYRAFLRTAARAGEELGLSFLDANKQLLSMPEILEVMRAKYGETLDAVEKREIQKAFGSDEAVALIDLMYSKTGALQDNILTLYQSMGQGVAITREMASAINETEPEKYVRLTQRLHNIKEEIGNQLLPMFNTMLQKGEVVLNKISEFIANNQQLVKVLSLVLLTIGLILTSMGILITIIGGVGLVFTKTAQLAGGLISGISHMRSGFETLRLHAMYAGDAMRKGFSSVRAFAHSAAISIRNVTTSIISMGRAALATGANAVKNFVLSMASMARQAIATAIRAMPGLIASVWSFTAALLANPITWIVIAIVALIAILVLLWRNWDTVVAAFNDGVANITNGFNRVKEIFANGIQSIKDSINGSLNDFREAGSKVLDTFTEGIKSKISAPVEAVKGGLAKIRNMLPFSDAKTGPLSSLTLSGRRVFETVTSGMLQTQNLPAEATEDAFARVDLTPQEGVKKVSLKEISKEKTESSSSSKERENTTIIEKLIIQADISKLKDLQMLFKLIKEIEDYTNSNGSDLTLAGEG